MPFKVTRKSGGDNQLPIAHTCFFQVPCVRPRMVLSWWFVMCTVGLLCCLLCCLQIELPEYSTDEIARSRIIAAANFGLGGFLIA